jgi:hypothetical protein
VSTAYRTSCTDCGWTATLPTEHEADRAGAAHTCPPAVDDYPTCGTCDRPMRPHRASKAEHPGTVAPQREGLCQSCHRGSTPRKEHSSLAALLGAGARLTVAEAEQALCSQTDPEAFFPDAGGSTQAAKAVCAACPIRARCLDIALANREGHGVWGGMSERERRNLLRQNRSAAA